MNKRLWIFLTITIALAVLISPFASSSPDGLERVAEDLGFIGLEQEPMYEIFPDYSLSFVSLEYLSTALSGFIGLVLTFLITYGSLWGYKRIEGRVEAREQKV